MGSIIVHPRPFNTVRSDGDLRLSLNLKLSQVFVFGACALMLSMAHGVKHVCVTSHLTVRHVQHSMSINQCADLCTHAVSQE